MNSPMQQCDNDAALSILNDFRSQWEWSTKGYSHDTDIIVLQGVKSDDGLLSYGLGRYLLCHHPTYLFYGEMYSAGRGRFINDLALFHSTMPPATIRDISDLCIMLVDDYQHPMLMLICTNCTLYIEEALL